MARRTYGENERTTVERKVTDREVIEAFVKELDGSSSVEEVLEGVDSGEDLEATARYNLIHPYEGENFSEYLVRGEDVTARVEFYVGSEDSNTEVYTGHISHDARDIFSPSAVVGLSEEDEVEEGEAYLEENEVSEPGTSVAHTD